MACRRKTRSRKRRGEILPSVAFTGTWCPFLGGAPVHRMLPSPLCSLLEPSRHISVPPARLQSWFIASSMYPIGDHSVLYVTIRLLLDNTGGLRLLLVLGCVCLYDMQLSRAAIGSYGWVTQNPEMIGKTSFLVLVLGGCQLGSPV